MKLESSPRNKSDILGLEKFSALAPIRMGVSLFIKLYLIDMEKTRITRPLKHEGIVKSKSVLRINSKLKSELQK